MRCQDEAGKGSSARARSQPVDNAARRRTVPPEDARRMKVLNRLAKRCLSHPLTSGLSIDDPRTTHLRRPVIESNAFLRRVYLEWYTALAGSLPHGDRPVLELGSGAGFLPALVPNVVTSEVFICPDVRVVLDGRALPFRDGSLRGILMTDVLHHVPEPRRFFAEAVRCLQVGGVVSMVEPWVSGWSRLVYTHLHHEPFDPEAPDWEFQPGGPLSGANGALPWMIFERDRATFERQFPHLRVQCVRRMMPFRYLLSGGVSLRNVVPAWSFDLWRGAEAALTRRGNDWAMFAQVTLVKS